MLNTSKIKKLITKNVRINGISFPPTEDKPGTDILFTIDGHVAFKTSSYDTEIVAKLIEVGAMEPNYTFTNTSDISYLFSTLATLPYTVTSIKLTDSKAEMCVMENEHYISLADKKFIDCFTGGTFTGKAQNYDMLYHVDNENVIGIIAPLKAGNHTKAITDIANKITAAVRINEGEDNFGHCSNCQRAEKLRTWREYNYCPCCGRKVVKYV